MRDKQMKELYKNTKISFNEFIDEVVDENDPELDYMLKRLTRRDKEIKYGEGGVKYETVIKFIRVMEVFNRNLSLPMNDIVEQSPEDIKKYVSYIAGCYKSKGFGEEIKTTKTDKVNLSGEKIYF